MTSDAWWILSAPARIDGRGAAALALVAGTGALIHLGDQDLVDATRRARANAAGREVLELGGRVASLGRIERTLATYAVAHGLATLIDFDGLQAVTGEILTSHAIGAGLRLGLRPLVGRHAPDDGRGPRSFRAGEGGRSFPDGTTWALFELATVAAQHGRSLPVTVAAYGLATAGALRRIESGGHWPSDVFLSAVSGTLIARAVVRRTEARKAADPMWYYALEEDGLRLGLVLRH